MDVRPPSGDFSYFESNPAWKEKLALSYQRLCENIKRCQPNMVILLGAEALQYFLRQRDVGSWRGHVFWCDDCECKVLATYNPLVAMRQQHVGKGQKPGQYSTLFRFDIGKAVRHSQVKELVVPKYKLLVAPSFLEAVSELQRLKEEATILSFDIETSGLACTCIGFADSVDHACCIPLLRNDGGVQMNYWGEQEHDVIYSLIVDLLRSDIPKVAQNGQFDIAVLEGVYGLKVNNLVWDTLVAAHNIYCDLPKDLGSLIALYTDMPYHKYMIRGTQVEFWEYNALDALVTLMIMLEQKKEMAELGTLSHYQNVTNPLIYPLIQLQLNGVRVDLNRRDKALARENQIIDDLTGVLQQLVPGFLPTSSTKCKELFYEVFRVKPVRNQGKLTTNSDMMEATIENDTRKVVQLFAEAVIKYREASHMRGVLQTPLADGRLQCAYSASGTDTGRLNSRESIFGTGTNLQNLQVGVPRQMIVPG